VEFDAPGARPSVLLTVPLGFLLSAGRLDRRLFVSAVAEPQYHLVRKTWRGVGLLRLDFGPVFYSDKTIFTRYGIGGVYGELGGVVGQDGHGFTFGGGASLMGYKPIRGMSVGFRATLIRWGAVDETRYDFVFDIFTLPFFIDEPKDWSLTQD